MVNLALKLQSHCAGNIPGTGLSAGVSRLLPYPLWPPFLFRGGRHMGKLISHPFTSCPSACLTLGRQPQGQASEASEPGEQRGPKSADSWCVCANLMVPSPSNSSHTHPVPRQPYPYPQFPYGKAAVSPVPLPSELKQHPLPTSPSHLVHVLFVWLSWSPAPASAVQGPKHLAGKPWEKTVCPHVSLVCRGRLGAG